MNPKDRLKFFFALLLPSLIFLPEILFHSSLYRIGFLFIICAFFIVCPKKWTQKWLTFCGVKDFDTDLKNRWEKLCYGIIYAISGIFIVLDCLNRDLSLTHWFPHQIETGLRFRLMWCFGWSMIGFSGAAVSDCRRKTADVQSPFPSYIYFYPMFLIANSFLIFGLVNLKNQPGQIFFYPMSAFICLNLGFWIDTINFNNLIAIFLANLGKLFNGK